MSVAFLVFSLSIYGQLSIKCLPDKGIKYAKIEAKIESENSQGNRNSKSQVVYYDASGRVVLIDIEKDLRFHKRIYKDDRLQFMITTSKKIPNFYSPKDLDSLMIYSEVVTDTAQVINYHSNGEVAELELPDGTFQLFEYKDCHSEKITFLNSDRDTTQQIQTIFENNVVVKTIWSPFPLESSEVVTKYYDYKFNKHGHWTSRRYKRNRSVVNEKRILKYY